MRNSQSAAYDFLSNISLNKPPPSTEKNVNRSPPQAHRPKGALRESSANVATSKLKKNDELTKSHFKQKPQRSDSDAADFLKGISLSGDKNNQNKDVHVTKDVPEETEGLSIKETSPQQKRVGKRRKHLQEKSPRSILKAFSKDPKKTRLVFSQMPNGGPLVLFSMIKYTGSEDDMLTLKRKKSTDNFTGASVNQVSDKDEKKKSVSYAYLLNSAWVNPAEHKKTDESEVSSTEEEPEERSYDPDFLDDPEFKTGKHRTVLNLPGFRGSLIPFIKPEDLKEELNEQFRQKHSWIQDGVTLHNIRKFKRKLLNVSLEAGLDPATVALGYVYLEKMLLKNLVSKEDLEFYGANKFYGTMLGVAGVRILLELLEKELGVSPKEVLQAEFDIFVKLSFSLFVESDEVMPHYSRLLTLIEQKQADDQ